MNKPISKNLRNIDRNKTVKFGVLNVDEKKNYFEKTVF